MANSKTTALTEISVPELDDLVFLVEDPDGTPTDRKCSLQRLLAAALYSQCQFRLTTESGVAVSTADRTAQSTLYLTPFGGGLIGLYDGTRWVLYVIPEIAIVLSSLTDAKNYDVFPFASSATPSSTNTSTEEITFGSAHGWNTGAVARVTATGGGLTRATDYFVRRVSSTVITLHTTLAGALANTGTVNLTASITASLIVVSLELSAAWTNDTTRADAITTQDGIAVKSGATTRRLVGTIRTTGTTTTEDSDAKRFVWSLYNQVPRRLMKFQGASASEHTYTTTTYREWNGGTGGPHRIYFVTGEVQTVQSSGWTEIYGGPTGIAQVSFTLNASNVEGLAVAQSGETDEAFGFMRTGLSGVYVSALGFNEFVVTEIASGSGSITFNYYRVMASVLG